MATGELLASYTRSAVPEGVLAILNKRAASCKSGASEGEVGHRVGQAIESTLKPNWEYVGRAACVPEGAHLHICQLHGAAL